MNLSLVQTRPAGGAGVSDHALLSHLAYADAAHTGFCSLATAQTVTGEKLIDSTVGLRFGHAAGPRLQGPAAGDLLTLTGWLRAGDRCGIATNPNATTALTIAPTFSQAAGNMYLINATPASCTFTGPGLGYFYGLYASAAVIVRPTATASLFGLSFTTMAAGAGTLTNLYASWVKAGLMSYSGPAPNVWGYYAASPFFSASTYPANAIGMQIDDMGGNPGAIATNAIGLKIADQTLVGGNKYLIEAGPATPNLRLLANAPPDAGLLTEGDSQALLAWMENGVVNLRRTRWRQYSSLLAADKVLIAA